MNRFGDNPDFLWIFCSGPFSSFPAFAVPLLDFSAIVGASVPWQLESRGPLAGPSREAALEAALCTSKAASAPSFEEPHGRTCHSPESFRVSFIVFRFSLLYSI